MTSNDKKTIRIDKDRTGARPGRGQNQWAFADDKQMAESSSRYGLAPNAQCASSLIQEDMLPGGDATMRPLVALTRYEFTESESEAEELEGVCSALVERLPSLGNDPSRTDAQFPEMLKSIAPPGTNCGDAAAVSAGSQGWFDCAQSNNWKPVCELMGKACGSGGTGGGGGGPAPERTPEPTPEPTPEVTPAPVNKNCVDGGPFDNPIINGGSSCEDLDWACGNYDFVRNKCKKTCKQC